MSSKNNYTATLSFIIIIVSIYWSFTSLLPKKISNNETNSTAFSMQNALDQLKVIAQKPHYVGSENHRVVRDYIVDELKKLGLTVEIQKQVAINTKWRAGTKTQNIVARIKGSANEGALLLLSHYDSAPHSSLGASDAGSGVVTILEGIRAFLAKKETPKNDIIILISDAEELGLLGANAFVNHHPWAKEVKLVLNFEARGSGGSSFLLVETNGGNKKLIQAFNQTHTKKPVGNSLLYSIYKMLPNDTDLTVFREDANIDGYNFAFIDDHFDYHTAQDSYERLDKKTLQHQADYLVPLLGYFANADINNLHSNEDFVFFNFPEFGLINYPFHWVKPMWIMAVLGFVLLLIIGFKNKKLNTREIIKGFIANKLSLFISALATYFIWLLLQKVYPNYQDILHGFTYNGHFYIMAFISLSIGLSFWFYRSKVKKYTVANLYIAPISIWLLINAAIAFYLPGAGFFILPVYIALVILGIEVLNTNSLSKKTILYAFLVIPVLLIFAPFAQLFPIGLGLKILFISAIITVLILGILLPIFATYKNLSKLSHLFFLLFVLGLISAAFTASYNSDSKKPNSILYVLDMDDNQAYWTTYNQNLDAFTQQFLGKNPTKGTFSSRASTSKYGTGFTYYQKTKTIPLAQPDVHILKDSIIGNHRNIHFQIVPNRKVNRIEIKSKNLLHFKSITINGEHLSPKKNTEFLFTTENKKHILSYFFTEDDQLLDVTFQIPKDENPQLEFFEASYDLFENKEILKLQKLITPRTTEMMPMPFVLSDAVVLKKSISF